MTLTDDTSCTWFCEEEDRFMFGKRPVTDADWEAWNYPCFSEAITMRRVMTFQKKASGITQRYAPYELRQWTGGIFANGLILMGDKKVKWKIITISSVRAVDITSKVFRARQFYEPDRPNRHSKLLQQIETDRHEEPEDQVNIFDFFKK